MNSGNGISKLIVGTSVAGIIIVLMALFNFSYQRASQAFETSVQNRERISVVETKFDDIKSRIEEQRVDVKEIKNSLADMKVDIQTLVNRN